MKTWTVLTLFACTATLAAGCQLLLPEADDGTTASSQGGAGSTSRASSSISGDKSSSGSTQQSASSGPPDTTVTSSSSMIASTTDASASSSTGVASSSSTGSDPTCGPSMFSCTGLDTGSLPSNCQLDPTAACGDAACRIYCSALKTYCPGQYGSGTLCCAACNVIKTEGATKGCCHVDALNGLAAGQQSPQACTYAGPFGTASNDGTTSSTCGTQSENVCALYAAICPIDAMTCTQATCVNKLHNEPGTLYSANSGSSSKLAILMDTVLSPSVDKCAEAVMQICGG
jgi:hypothetical protein